MVVKGLIQHFCELVIGLVVEILLLTQKRHMLGSDNIQSNEVDRIDIFLEYIVFMSVILYLKISHICSSL